MCVGGIVPQWTKVWALNSGATGIVAPGHYLHMRLRCCWFPFPREHNEKTITLKLRVYVSGEQGLWFSVWILEQPRGEEPLGKPEDPCPKRIVFCPQQILNGELVMDEIGPIRWLISTLQNYTWGCLLHRSLGSIWTRVRTEPPFRAVRFHFSGGLVSPMSPAIPCTWPWEENSLKKCRNDCGLTSDVHEIYQRNEWLIYTPPSWKWLPPFLVFSVWRPYTGELSSLGGHGFVY